MMYEYRYIELAMWDEQLVFFIHCRVETDLGVWQMIFMADCHSMKYEYHYIELTMWGSHEPKFKFFPAS